MRSWVTSRQDLQLDEPTPELPPQMLSGRSVERGQRLVEQEQMRPTDQRARQRDALLLSSGQLPRIAVSETGQPEQRRDLLDALPPLRRRDLAQAVAEVLGYTSDGGRGRNPGTGIRSGGAAAGENTTRGVEPDFVTDTDGAALRPVQAGQAS